MSQISEVLRSDAFVMLRAGMSRVAIDSCLIPNHRPLPSQNSGSRLLELSEIANGQDSQRLSRICRMELCGYYTVHVDAVSGL